MEVDDKSLRDNVRDVGGGWNKSCLFLPAINIHSNQCIFRDRCDQEKRGEDPEKQSCASPFGKVRPLLVDG